MSDDDTHWLPILVQGDVTDWERGFCASLIAQTRRGRRLSEKQAGILRRIRDDFRARVDLDSPDLIESSHDAKR